ncbi:hypothetical protein E4O05_05585 [Treponema sp. OMZ 787]|uniref:hypothetical protein n=1 Tax=Treponema sp. OMZ 787 TaxID=2563669 RepID=UPI0020A4E64F|nr:hypothetical protein [Treponema sp. OMZ 787]UTC63357.1 hypothetical protein E4O05_05585 [Treponema sp. OMZ 787]
MKKALNRIEYEYIADTFVREKPPLSILCNNTFVKIDSFFYKIIDGYIFFKADGVEVNDDIKVFFNHKKRPLYFLSRVEKKDGILVFKISDKFYKHDDELKNCQISLRNSSGVKLKAGISRDFTLSFPYPPVVDDEESEAFFSLCSKVSAMMNISADKIPGAFFYRLYETAIKHKTPDFSPCLLYADADFLLIFCVDKKAEDISALQTAQMEISFDRRNVKCLSTFSFYLPKLQLDSSGESCGVLCLTIKSIQEEDKRFLHEKAHSSKYGYQKTKF